jgi:hypothetical protein
MMRRPRLIVEVYEVTGADALNTKLQSLLDTGMMITSVTPVTADGKSMIVIVGMPAQQPRMPMPSPQLPPGHPGAQVAGAPPSAQAGQGVPQSPAKP